MVKHKMGTPLRDLPVLPLDRKVPSYALRRRMGISFASDSAKIWTSGPLPSRVRKERRGAISFDNADRDAQYVRMLGDVKLQQSSEASTSADVAEQEAAMLHDSDTDILDNCEQCLKRGSLGQTSSVHPGRRRRWRAPADHKTAAAALRFSPHHSSFVDDHYVGQAKCLLSTVGDWNFNIFNLDKLTNGRSLFHISLHLFQHHNLIETFRLDIVKLMRCITLIEEGYHSANPYHNATHAADVLQAMHCYLAEERLASTLTPLETLAALLSAITHDLDHPGVNQAFLIATSNHLAALYDNTSVLENHHWRSAVAILRESGLLSHFDAEAWGSVEKQLRSLILATDITRQPEFLGQLKSHLDAGDLDLPTSWEQRHLMLQIALKCADICNPCRPWALSRRWSQLVCLEFFQQGDYERKLGLPLTPLCNKELMTVAKIQIGFMQCVVEPLFREWNRFNGTPLSARMLRQVQRNSARWQRLEAAGHGNGSSEDDCGVEGGEEEEGETEEDSIDSCAPQSHVVQCQVEPVPPDSAEEEEEQEEGVDGEDENEDEEDDGAAPSSPLPRRHSMPKVVGFADTAVSSSSAPSSGARHNRNRRHSLPMVLALSFSLDKLSEKLAMIAECMPPTNGNKAPLGLDMALPQIGQLGEEVDLHALEEASLAGSTITSAHGLPHLAESNAAMVSSLIGRMAGLKRRASAPYDHRISSDKQPLITADTLLSNTGDSLAPHQRLLLRRHSDLPQAPSRCAFPPTTTSTTGSGCGSRALLHPSPAGAACHEDVPLLPRSHDCLSSLLA